MKQQPTNTTVVQQQSPTNQLEETIKQLKAQGYDKITREYDPIGNPSKITGEYSPKKIWLSISQFLFIPLILTGHGIIFTNLQHQNDVSIAIDQHWMQQLRDER